MEKGTIEVHSRLSLSKPMNLSAAFRYLVYSSHHNSMITEIEKSTGRAVELRQKKLAQNLGSDFSVSFSLSLPGASNFQFSTSLHWWPVLGYSYSPDRYLMASPHWLLAFWCLNVLCFLISLLMAGFSPVWPSILFDLCFLLVPCCWGLSSTETLKTTYNRFYTRENFILKITSLIYRSTIVILSTSDNQIKVSIKYELTLPLRIYSEHIIKLSCYD